PEVDGGPGVDSGGLPDSGQPDAGFTTAAHRSFPAMPYNGGNFLSPMTWVTIVASNDADQASLFQFSDDLITSSWWTAVTSEYGIAAPARSIHVTGPAITADMTNAQLITYIQQQGATVSPANGNTL